jgi:hypothetical protein
MFGPLPEFENSSCWPVSVSEKPPMANSKFAESSVLLMAVVVGGVEDDIGEDLASAAAVSTDNSHASAGDVIDGGSVSIVYEASRQDGSSKPDLILFHGVSSSMMIMIDDGKDSGRCPA